MNDRAPRMVATDLDGTLLNSELTVSDRNARALQRAEAAGALVVVATGRPVWWLGAVRDTGFTGTCVSMNGAVIYQMGEHRVLETTPLQPEVMWQFAEALERELPGASIAVERMGIDDVDSWSEEHYDHPWEEGEFRQLTRQDLLAEPAVKMLIRQGDDSSRLAQVAKDTGFDLSITYSTNAGLIEVMAPGVNKGVALQRIAAEHGIDAADVIAFGDMNNDTEMLTWAGRSYAMADAHPSAIAAAKDRAPDHDDDGVAQILERWF